MDTRVYPIINAGTLLNRLKKSDFSVVKTERANKLLVNSSGRRIVIPAKRNTIISPVLLKHILRDAAITLDDFLNA